MPSQIHQYYTNIVDDFENEEIAQIIENSNSENEESNGDVDEESDNGANADIFDDKFAEDMEDSEDSASEEDEPEPDETKNDEEVVCLFPMPNLYANDIEIIKEVRLPDPVYKLIEKFSSMAIEKAEIINELIPE